MIVRASWRRARVETKLERAFTIDQRELSKLLGQSIAASKGDVTEMDAEQLKARLRLMELVSGGWVSKTIAIAAELNIADLVADGPQSPAALAAATKTHEPTLRRLLRGLAAIGLLVDGEDGRFAETPLLHWLRSDTPGSVRPVAIMLHGEPHNRGWDDLLNSVKTGETAVDRVYGMGIFDFYAKNSAEDAVFNDAMTQLSTGVTQAVVGAFDYSRFATIVDVGGGHGALLAAILAGAPKSRGILFDQPEVTKGAAETFRRAGLDNRIEIVSGSFFDSVPAGADAYVMKHIIHDWNDDKSVTILSRCREAMDPDGRVLLVERLLPERITDPAAIPGTMMDLNMLAVTGGRERTESEFRSLFERSGLSWVGSTPTPSPFHVIEAAAKA